MRILQLNPIEVNSFTRSYDNIIRNNIIVGKCKKDNYYLSDLYFPPVILKNNEIIVKAVLKMYCNDVCGSCDSITVCINNDNVSADIKREGNYEWDITSLIKSHGEHNLKLCAYSKTWIRQCNIKEFETLDFNTMPVLEVIVDEVTPNIDNKIVNIVNEYTSTQRIRHSDWMDCISFNEFYYFVKNLGSSDLEVAIEISPDKNLVYQDTDYETIEANKVYYMQPMRKSRFVRLSYKNLLPNSANLIKVWLQGKI